MATSIESRYPALNSVGSGIAWFGFSPLSVDSNQFPFQMAAGGVSMVADARVDGMTEPSWADRVVKLYLRDGPECVRGLAGEFALAIWDLKNQSLFLARDPMGVKPLFYYAGPQVCVFASDIRDVLAHPAVSQEYDEPAIVHYLTSVEEPSWDSTLFRYIKRLPPGHWLSYSPWQTRIGQYWSPSVVSIPVRGSDPRDYSAYLHSLLQESVRNRLPHRSLCGAHLSGGLDSSALAVLAARELRTQGRRLETFSWSPPPPAALAEADERNRIRDICLREGITCHYSRRYSHEAREFLTRDPSREPVEMAFLEEPVQASARQLGVKVMLSGWGGDEFASFNGRGVLPAAFLGLEWSYLWRELTAIAHRRNSGRMRTFLSKVITVLLPDLLYFRRFPSESVKNFLSPRFKRLKTHSYGSREIPRGRANMEALWCMGHLAKRMESWAASGAAADIDYRYPLLDLRVVEFCYSVPEWLHQFRGYSRFLFRQAVEALLPPAMVWGFPKDEQSVWTMIVAPHLDPEPGALLRTLKQKAEAKKAGYVDLDLLLAEWDEPASRGPLRSRAIQAVHLAEF